MVVGCRGLVTCLQQYIAQFLDLQGFTVTKTITLARIDRMIVLVSWLMKQLRSVPRTSSGKLLLIIKNGT